MTVEARIEVARGDFRLAVETELSDGEVVALLGPNGSGKTTFLKVLAGLIPLDGGMITVDDKCLDDPQKKQFLLPSQRPVALVFQDYLLFPHMSVLDNVAFGLRARGVAKADARDRANEWLGRFDIAEKSGARPAELSGGQAQKVALARALVTAPRLLMLDEPLSALDAASRVSVRRDLLRHLSEFGGATLLVTHDPVDALTLATRVVVLESGAVAQTGTVEEITRRPRSRYVADLAGLNLYRGSAAANSIALTDTQGEIVIADKAEGEVFALIHPDAVSLYVTKPAGSQRNLWPGRIDGIEALGDRVRVHVGGVLPLVAEVTAAAVAELGLHEGKDVWAGVKATEVSVYPA
ncbi:MAG: ABC transporter ATP-binding protein [Acidobacteria bacterium]|nr:MAG: ABC transporter ATP-binding protein [Acidobacteriota bacterium]